MKKFLKALIALVIIGGLAFGIYMIFFNNKTDNSQIYTKVQTLNNLETYTKVNNTIYEMLKDIQAHPEYELDEVQNYFTVYVQTMKNYELVRLEIINNGLFINQTNTGDSYKNMNASYDTLVNIYISAENYLKDTYWVNQRETYIENFYIKFENALNNLNGFYYNAGISILKCLDNGFDTNNHFKLEMEYYLNLSSRYVNHYLTTNENASNISSLIEQEHMTVYIQMLDLIKIW